MKTVHIGLIGDYSTDVPAHRAIPPALALAAGSIGGVRVETAWLPTDTLAGLDDDLLTARLSAFDGLWCVPASPYANEQGALAAIRFACENGVPFLGTCGGFQHALLEYARDVLGLTDAQHAENHPETVFPLLAPLSCALVEKENGILLREGSRTRQIYGQAQVREAYRCSFGLNPAYEARLDDGRLLFAGREESGEVRVSELAKHPFFIATLFQPERSALRENPAAHPLIRAYVDAVLQRPTR